MSKNTLEKEVEKKLTEMVERHGGLCLKWVCPGWSGVPDRIILLPGGHIIFCEVKRPQGSKTQALQIWWRNRLQKKGFPAVSVKNIKEVDLLEDVITETLKH